MFSLHCDEWLAIKQAVQHPGRHVVSCPCVCPTHKPVTPSQITEAVRGFKVSLAFQVPGIHSYILHAWMKPLYWILLLIWKWSISPLICLCVSKLGPKIYPPINHQWVPGDRDLEVFLCRYIHLFWSSTGILLRVCLWTSKTGRVNNGCGCTHWRPCISHVEYSRDATYEMNSSSSRSTSGDG